MSLALDRVLLSHGSQLMASPSSRVIRRPAKDEWGVYDPQQAGIAALVARLDARAPKTITAPAPAVAREKTETVEPAAAPARPSLKDAQ